MAALLVFLDLVSNQPFVSGVFSSGSSETNSDLQKNNNARPPNYLDLCPIAILAFESAGQVCLSRVLSVIELPTIVLSTLYHDFTADLYGTYDAWQKSTSVFNFLFIQQRRQAKRLLSIVGLFVGGVVGGEMYKSAAGMAGALFMAAALKAAIAISFALWNRDPEDDDEGLPA